jgi:hypothetical protein
MYNLQTLEHYGNPLSCLPRSVKRIFNFQNGNYLPACSNHSVESFLTNRVAQKGTCEGFGKRRSYFPSHDLLTAQLAHLCVVLR